MLLHQVVKHYFRQMRTLCQWLPNLKANCEAGAFLATGINGRKTGFDNLDLFNPVGLPNFPAEAFEEPLPQILPSDEDIDKSLLGFITGIVLAHVSHMRFHTIESVHGYVKKIASIIMLNKPHSSVDSTMCSTV